MLLMCGRFCLHTFFLRFLHPPQAIEMLLRGDGYGWSKADAGLTMLLKEGLAAAAGASGCRSSEIMSIGS